MGRNHETSTLTGSPGTRLRLAVLGFGAHPEEGLFPPSLWLETLAQSAASLEAVCLNNEPAKAQELCRRYGGRWPFAALAQILQESEFELAVLFAPLSRRAELIRDLLKARRSVLVPGLPSPDVREAARLLTMAEKNKNILLLGWPGRFSPAFLKTRQLLRSGRLGQVTSVFLNEAVVKPADDLALADPLDDLASGVDRAVQLAGLPAEVFARTTPLGPWSITMTGPDGVLANLLLQFVRTPDQTASRLDIRTSEDGCVVLKDGYLLHAYSNGSLVEHHRPGWQSGSQSRVELGYAGLVAEALATLNSRRSAPGSLELSTWLDTWRVLEAIRKSAETAKVVRL